MTISPENMPVSYNRKIVSIFIAGKKFCYEIDFCLPAFLLAE